jgi:ferredoxin
LPKKVTAVRLSVDQARCEGFGYCETEAPDLLHIDDDGDLVLDVDALDAEQSGRARAAVRVCPVAALIISSEAGDDPDPTPDLIGTDQESSTVDA